MKKSTVVIISLLLAVCMFSGVVVYAGKGGSKGASLHVELMPYPTSPESDAWGKVTYSEDEKGSVTYVINAHSLIPNQSYALYSGSVLITVAESNKGGNLHMQGSAVPKGARLNIWSSKANGNKVARTLWTGDAGIF